MKTNKMSLREFKKAYLNERKPSKFNTSSAVDRTWKGFWHWQREILFDSKAEMRRFCQLLVLEKKQQIYGLQLQPTFLLQKAPSKSVKDSYYISDFFYYEKGGVRVAEDVKGSETQQFKRKIKIARDLYDVEFRVIPMREV